MSAVAYFLARQVWAFMLWFMRRPAIKKARRRSPGFLPARIQERARKQMIDHDRFARLYGFKILVFSMNILVASILLTIATTIAIRLIESGILTVPDEVRERVGIETEK